MKITIEFDSDHPTQKHYLELLLQMEAIKGAFFDFHEEMFQASKHQKAPAVLDRLQVHFGEKLLDDLLHQPPILLDEIV